MCVGKMVLRTSQKATKYVKPFQSSEAERKRGRGGRKLGGKRREREREELGIFTGVTEPGSLAPTARFAWCFSH